jgi:hypothetical protein
MSVGVARAGGTRALRARHRHLVERDRRAWNGIPFEKPYQRVRDTVRFLRRALRGEKVTRTTRRSR